MSDLTLPAIVIDTETSGWATDPEARVIELGAVYVDVRGVIMSEFSMVVRPDGGLPDKPSVDKALEVSGFSREDVEHGVPERKAMDAFAHWFANVECAPRAGGMTAFNVGFDQPMLERSPYWALFAEDWGPCIMLAAKAYLVGIGQPPLDKRGRRKGRVSLAEAAAHFGLEHEGRAHRALADARLAAQVLVRLLGAS